MKLYIHVDLIPERLLSNSDIMFKTTNPVIDDRKLCNETPRNAKQRRYNSASNISIYLLPAEPRQQSDYAEHSVQTLRAVVGNSL